LGRNEYGEFELVLGNRQLVSVFLIVVILLGVFFSMGYIVGRNSSPGDSARNTAPPKQIVVPKPTDQDASATTPAEDNKEAPSSDSKPAPAAATTPIPIPPPAKATPEEKAKPSPMDKPVVTPTKPTPKPAEKAKASEGPRIAISDPAPGQYWQVMAAERADAELIAEELSKKGMKALLAPAPKEGYYRVLVGPFSNPANMAEIRTSLEGAGFKNPIVRKY
jgi:cell division septation protein DedD